jgi:uncharacterized protein YnzC (UPF0291/DUF896 family)
MKFLKRYNQYLESLQIDLSTDIIDLMESLIIWHDVLLSSIGAEEVDLVKTLSLENFDNLDLDYLSENIEFLNSLASLGLKKSPVQNTEDFEAFLNKPCRFMLIYDINSNELENPEYIIFQNWTDSIKKWDDEKLYKVNDDIKKSQYQSLTSEQKQERINNVIGKAVEEAKKITEATFAQEFPEKLNRINYLRAPSKVKKIVNDLYAADHNGITMEEAKAYDLFPKYKDLAIGPTKYAKGGMVQQMTSLFGKHSWA